MTTEEKAKAYDEALERAMGIHSFSSDIAEIKRMEQIFPELAESEDERVRKVQLDYWRSVGGKEWHGVPVQEAIAWLEKQNPVKFNNEEDERIRKSIICGMNALKDQKRETFATIPIDDCIIWLKKQGEKSQFNKERLMEVAKPETFEEQIKHWQGMCSIAEKIEKELQWTEEDEKCIDNCCLLIGAADDCYEKTFKDDCIHYLQRLKERITWKTKWTDEDEKRLQYCISSLQGKGLMGGVDTINTKWLKSLKQRIEEL